MTQTTERLTLAQFIARHGITASSTRAEHNPHYDGHMDDDHWRVTLYRTAPTYYRCGSCDHWHNALWDGDCRQDDARISTDQLEAWYPSGDWAEVDMADVDAWRKQARRSDAKMTVYFSMGGGHGGRAPEVADVLECMASDSAAAGIATSSGDAPSDFADWCSEYGYDTDSRKAHRTYIICKRQAERLRKFLGEEAYEQLLWNTERL